MELPREKSSKYRRGGGGGGRSHTINPIATLKVSQTPDNFVLTETPNLDIFLSSVKTTDPINFPSPKFPLRKN